jgi:C-terminal processing protease CtpA/Prc
LLPFFFAPNAEPEVLNVAAYRLGHKRDLLDARWLYPADWEGWSDAERESISRLARTFTPQWQLPQGQFSEWHYFVIGPSEAPGYYHYSAPVVVLMNSTNFSAADIFLGAFEGHPNVTLMGTPSGGGSGRARHTWLHESSICVSLSSMASFRPSGLLYEGRGIQPDILMEPEPGYFIAESDETLQAAMDLLRTKK